MKISWNISIKYSVIKIPGILVNIIKIYTISTAIKIFLINWNLL